MCPGECGESSSAVDSFMAKGMSQAWCSARCNYHVCYIIHTRVSVQMRYKYISVAEAVSLCVCLTTLCTCNEVNCWYRIASREPTVATYTPPKLGCQYLHHLVLAVRLYMAGNINNDKARSGAVCDFILYIGVHGRSDRVGIARGLVIADVASCLFHTTRNGFADVFFNPPLMDTVLELRTQLCEGFHGSTLG